MFLSRKKYDVISVGSAVVDYYFESKNFISIDDKKFETGKGICLSLGSKLFADDVHFTTGGGALNSAISFVNHGLNAAVACKIGNDTNGTLIVQRVKDAGIADNFIVVDKERKTTMSVLFHAKEGERSVITNKGASNYLTSKDLDVSKLLFHTRWLYITHIPPEAEGLFDAVLSESRKRGVKVALNPGKTQLKMGKKLVPYLKSVDIFFVNQEEASILTGVDYKQEKKLFETLDDWVDGLVVMTKGKEGSIVSDGTHRWEAGCLKDKGFADRTGAGDAFGSGFTSAIIRHGTVEDALQEGSANATAVIREWGANRGLLTINDLRDMFGKLQIKKVKIK